MKDDVVVVANNTEYGERSVKKTANIMTSVKQQYIVSLERIYPYKIKETDEPTELTTINSNFNGWRLDRSFGMMKRTYI